MPKVGEQKFDKSDSSLLIDAIDWAIAQNSNRDSPYYGKIATESIGVSGMSCGGLQALEVAPDRRIKTVGVFNSGILPTPGSGIRSEERRVGKEWRDGWGGDGAEGERGERGE